MEKICTNPREEQGRGGVHQWRGHAKTKHLRAMVRPACNTSSRVPAPPSPISGFKSGAYLANVKRIALNCQPVKFSQKSSWRHPSQRPVAPPQFPTKGTATVANV